MTDRAGTPAEPDPPAAEGTAPGGTPEQPRRRHWLRWTALGVSVVVLAAAGAGWWFYRKLDGNITTDTTAADELRRYEKERPPANVSAARNILLIGSDTRAGEENRKYGKDVGTQRSDTTILLHLAAGKKSATAVSLPRDLMVTLPSCRKADGTRTREQFAQFNWAFEFGGTACTIRTVEKLTGIRVDHHMVIDFRGFKKMVDAVDGVEVCLKEPVDDPAAKLKLPAGRQTLHGEQALGFVRARKSLGNGSDTERMDRQQQFLGALVNKVQSDGVLLNPTKLYPVLDAATKAITTDPGLDSLRDLYDLARSMRAIPTEKVQFLTVPRRPYAYNANRDELVQPAASQLFKQLREDRPVAVTPDVEKDSGGGGADGKPDDADTPTPSVTPTFTGRNAAEGVCS
ncbi:MULTISPECIES: LCP family protein [Streptomyces]|uniref:Cell envelope-associated transcriptional attenuator LytR-CpsA-Psr, subfamily A1 n=1 Tax=Streptomyces venezuelae (strain ATCC 10712 / CBS 650.69 / DSM 40230 / JCM 4526 / NBRC 13096 / PD 04745) TaxID=953739 RepID=F2R619_STRVP|nr:LCP family protein [Streptomyces venezuelae]APE21963.1 LytR family transcriptional regulator [Streptomyces venezuelae]QER99356.1 LytR family transcriptional regulator [Streptomyces venezuelae ATCC 10712]CCA56070.1 Cell envelope-associated transcriptional attenuator LytR-CpsA-Psr, subfamily A1 [Streptomyces venezuelae ATCC 10712]